MRDRIMRKFVEQSQRREREQAGEQKENIAPAEIVAEHAAGGLAEQLTENIPRDEAAEHRLASLVGDNVADESKRQRNDRASCKAAAEARRHQLRQRSRQPAQRNQNGRRGGGGGHAEILAEAVADRADDQLHRAMA